MSSYVTRKTPGDMEWFTHDRFGMFIHFGLYSMAARVEWCKCFEGIPEEKYDLFFKNFNPDLLDAKEWARMAKEAGMKYAILTTKHHEGFCLFDTKYTDYNVMNTPYGKDIVREYVDAFRAEGIKIGFYYSLLDWHHPDYTIDRCHPRVCDTDPIEFNKGRDMSRYAQYMRNQVEELLTNYGKIDILWFDFSIIPDKKWEEYHKGVKSSKLKEDWESEKLIELVRKLQPGIIINNRTGIDQDITTPEQYQMQEWVKDPETGELINWEACHTFSGSWGYARDEMTWKSPDVLINMLIRTVSCGGNFIMNVGPTSRGYFDHRAVAGLETYAKWMKYNGRSLYGCTMAEPEFKAPNGCLFTQSTDGKRLYIHLVEYPYNFLEIHGLAGKIEYAQMLHDGSEIKFSEGTATHISSTFLSKADDLVFMNIPLNKPDMITPVIEVFLK